MKKYSIIILILCSWAMSLFAISCSDQESKPQPFLEIKKDTVVFAQEAANTSIVVNTNIAWQASVPSSGNWCTVQGADDLLSISVEKNTGRDLRETDIVVKGEGLEQKVHVKQLGEQPDILLENERLNLNYTDTVVTVKVVSNVEYEVEIPQNADWIKEMKQQVQVRAMAESERTFSIERNEDEHSKEVKPNVGRSRSGGTSAAHGDHADRIRSQTRGNRSSKPRNAADRGCEK